MAANGANAQVPPLKAVAALSQFLITEASADDKTG